MQELKEIVESWNVLKKNRDSFNQQDMRQFIETMNAHTRKLISALQIQDPDFYMGLCELAQNGSTLVTPNARIFGDGIDRTSL